ncbi:MAG: bifunctional glutamate N-acetyltransferase/amino-acid acetyltransferase ArgJ [Geminicoccaceae bacterium]
MPLVSPLAPARFPDIPVIEGLRFSALACGLRYRQRLDLTLIEVADGSSVAGVFTRSSTAGHPVHWCRRALVEGEEGRGRAVIVNAGNANVFNGRSGEEAVLTEVQAVATALNCEPHEIFVCSTGVIGEPLDAAAIAARVPELVASLDARAVHAAAEAIMTTDTFIKGSFREAAIDGRKVLVAGIAKGSGMIEPNMATMLAFLFTDASLPANVMSVLLHQAVAASFNKITVDGDTSTSDTVLFFATQTAAHDPVLFADDGRLDDFRAALEEVCLDLALLVVRDGEGAQKLIEIRVDGAASDDDAAKAAKAIANSPLVKTAVAGSDANWGRVVMAVGKAGVAVDPAKLSVRFGGVVIAEGGGAVPGYDEALVQKHLQGRDILLEVGLGVGASRGTVWTCDLTHGYIDINADYRS